MDVTMPQLGETVTEGTITRWFKQVGERVEVDEPLFEVSTDKVDSEVPAPAAGVVSEILVPEGETVDVGVRLAVIDGAGAPTAAPPEAAPEPEAQPPEPEAPAPEPEPERGAAPAPAAPPAPAARAARAGPGDAPGVVVSPIVRRLAAEHGVDVSQITGTGDGGRVTRNDVLAAAKAGGAPARPAEPRAPSPPAPRASGDETIPFDNIRRRTAEHMVRSKATSPHVYTSVQVDFERIEAVRRANRDEWKAEEGFSLTYLPFLVRAVSEVVHEYPHVNASVGDEALVVHRDVNVAIAVDLDFKGLLAPVIRSADGKRLRLIAREIRDLASRAKSKGLGPDDVVGGTFTITNMGPFGTQLTLPIINQPQVAILATDGVGKAPVVIEGPDGEDAIAIHHVGIVSLAWDHRAFDGAYAAAFLSGVREVLETHDWESELA